MSSLHVEGGRPLQGRVTVPGDKSISHRALLFAGLAQGASRVRHLLRGGDCLATLACIQKLGVPVTADPDGGLVIAGQGLRGLSEPAGLVDCGNSGTTLRLLAGLLAGQRFNSFLCGSSQLMGRPMARIVDPLRAMGAHIIGRQGGRLAPLAIEGSSLAKLHYTLPVASAQVKSCLLLAGLYADGGCVLTEPAASRDHSEILLARMGVRLQIEGLRVALSNPEVLQPFELDVPGDVSSAAFPLVAAALLPGSELCLEGVGVNPRRTGLLEALTAMGASCTYESPREATGEAVADLVVRPAQLQGTNIGGALIPRMIDELPILAVAATQAHGVTHVRDAAELRVKETDRIATTVSELRKLGAHIEAAPDGFVVEGPTQLRGAPVDSQGDHRLAMALTVAGLLAAGVTKVCGTEVCADSFPGFVDLLRALGARLTEVEA